MSRIIILLLVIILCTSPYLFAIAEQQPFRRMPFPAIQQKAPEFTVSALMPNKVTN